MAGKSQNRRRIEIHGFHRILADDWRPRREVRGQGDINVHTRGGEGGDCLREGTSAILGCTCAWKYVVAANRCPNIQAVLNGVFACIGADYEYFNLVNIELHEMANNQVLATLRYQAKLKKNGATYYAQAAHLWTFKNGKAIAFQQYLDTKKVADAIAK